MNGLWVVVIYTKILYMKTKPAKTAVPPCSSPGGTAKRPYKGLGARRNAAVFAGLNEDLSTP